MKPKQTRQYSHNDMSLTSGALRYELIYSHYYQISQSQDINCQLVDQVDTNDIKSILMMIKDKMRLSQITIIFVVILAINSLEIKNPLCNLCHQIVNTTQHSVPRRPSEFLLEKITTAYCTKAHIQDHAVCKGAVDQMMDSIINSIWRHYTDPHAVCHQLRFCPKQYIYRNLTKDITAILKDKKQKPWETPTKRKTLKVVHISDLHLDLYYTVGAPSKCSEPICCRSSVNKRLSLLEVFKQYERGNVLQDHTANENPAGYWGSLSECDLPFQTYDLFLQELKEHNVDLVLWTGDNTPHDIWQQSQSYNLNYTIIETERMKRFTNAKVIAAMGNHQSYPVNVYDYQGEREKMLISGLAETWKPWLTPAAYEMLRTKGYFSIVIPEMNNLKIISVNTQAQNRQNWYLLRNPTDPGGMLNWIEDELKDSERQNQFVYIIGHISPKSALNEWAMRFNALTDRYSYTIRGQFYGHTHIDQLGFFPSFKDKDTLVNYFFIAPSLTCESNKHPEYRIMEVDFDTLQVLNYNQYRLDLNKFQKKQDKAKFQIFYNFKEAYGLSDMTIEGGLTTLMKKLKSDNKTQMTYTYLRSSGVAPGETGKDIICDATTSPQFEADCLGKSLHKNGFDKVAGRWKDLKHKED